MNLRSLLYAWCTVVLLFAQQDAYRHALTHLETPAAAGKFAEGGKGLAHGKTCDKCIVFAGIDSTAVASQPILEIQRGPIESSPAPAAAFHSEVASHYLSRAPPSLA